MMIAVCLNQDTSPTEIVNRDGALIFPPFTQEGVELQEDTRLICGPRTVYVGVTQFPWNSNGGEVVTFNLFPHRLVLYVKQRGGVMDFGLYDSAHPRGWNGSVLCIFRHSRSLEVLSTEVKVMRTPR